MPSGLETISSKFTQLNKDFPAFLFFLSTIFMVFLSVHAVHKWPGLWAQVAIPLACILPAIAVLFKIRHDLIRNEKWPVEIKLVLAIVVLGLLNICFSENQHASFKGMGLFLMSGVLVFAISYFLFNSKHVKKAFFYLCTFCFISLLIIGAFEFIQQVGASGKRILLLSSNPIPAGSLLILLSIGPLFMFGQAESKREKILWGSCLLAGVLLTILIGQKGPVLALFVMAFVWKIGFRKASLFFLL